ncbi:helix-turn-helix domain-containing protein [Phenylobacterium sp.]|jgi:transcriptional regulator with XRE-family HTH domain|uniref:helix-turn-helix domain-containing protein n=1 Tax=Phenylobacterium sp. TaxID=1871053 RepID=UPI002F95DA05
MTKPIKPAGLTAVGQTDPDAHPVDRHVGLRIRMRRKELGVSQERLADAVGLTFQQVQKYERGANRVSASRLWEIAGALQVGIGYFYEGLPEPSEGDAAPVRRDVEDLLLINDGPELAQSFLRVRDPKVRRKIVELIRAMAEEAEQA